MEKNNKSTHMRVDPIFLKSVDSVIASLRKEGIRADRVDVSRLIGNKMEKSEFSILIPINKRRGKKTIRNNNGVIEI